ncbi:MAG: ATPase, T2SS/T4P/T4SS family [Deltaproteobacteria bacterium]|nr:ATPase, T2SS/T4P/T4SS family [Deltaproteobacteria bacterium]
MYKLVITEKGGPSKELDFDKDEVTIGRVPGNDIVLPGNNVSKRHSRVVRQDGRYFVVDLKSTNGTYLNGRRIMTPSPLRAGDKIFVGNFIIVLDGSDLPASDELGLDDVALESASLVEPLPLDQEPMESTPPPPVEEHSSRPTFATSSRAAMATQPLSTAAAVAATNALANASNPTLGRGLGAAASRASGSLPATGAGMPQRPPTSTASTAVTPPLASASSTPAQPLPNPPVSRPSTGGVGARTAQPPVGAGARSVTSGWPRPSTTTQPAQTAQPPVNAVSIEEAEIVPIEAPAEVSATPQPTASDYSRQEPEPQAERIQVPARDPVRPTVSMSTVNVAPQVVESIIDSHRSATEPLPAGDSYALLLGKIVEKAIEAGVVSHPTRIADAAQRQRIRATVDGLVRAISELPAQITHERVTRDATAELAGAGAIESALADVETTSVQVAPSGRVYVGYSDVSRPSAYWFSSGVAVHTAVTRLLEAASVERVKDQPVVECTLSDGAHLTAVWGAGASAPSVSIRRPAVRPVTVTDLSARHMLSRDCAALLISALEARRNILIVGPHGSGRSTLLTALVGHFAAHQRTVALENRPVVSQRFRDVSSVPLLKDAKRSLDIALSLQPQRLVVSQMDESLAASIAALMVTGAEGLLLVTESVGADAVLTQLATGPGASLRGSATLRPVVVQMARLGDGTARVVSIGEGSAEGDRVSLSPWMTASVGPVDDSGLLDVTLYATGATPAFGVR